MKVRFDVDVPSDGVRTADTNTWVNYCLDDWGLTALTKPSAKPINGWTRVAFDVDMPPHLVLPPHDVMAPAGAAVVIDEDK